MTKTRIYLDNAATTRISDRVLEEMLPYLKDSYGNPSALYFLGREASIAINDARQRIAKCLGCSQREIYFTSGGSESDNWVIKSTAKIKAAEGKRHIITTAFEHHAVLQVMEELEKDGFQVTYLPVYENGIVKPEDVEKAIRQDTALVSVMYVNNEIGTIQPIPEIGKICHKAKVTFHTDAVQGVGNLSINVKEQNIDALSLSGHKIHGPKGVGVLYCSEKLHLPPLIHGGAQESNRRAGTENVAGIVGLARAMEDACSGIDEKRARLLKLRDKIIGELSRIPCVRLNGDPVQRIAGIVNLSFDKIEGEALLLQLDLKGIAAGSGSACTSGSLNPSHVLLALGCSPETARGSLRISMSDMTTEGEVEELLSVLPGIVEKLRKCGI